MRPAGCLRSGCHYLLGEDLPFPDSGDVRVDWSRWFKRPILAASDQILGAERWLRTHPNRVFVDERCTQPFPIAPESCTDCRFTRIVVAHDPGGRRASLTGGSGTLGVDPDIIGVAHYQSDLPGHRRWGSASSERVVRLAYLLDYCIV